MNKNNSTISSVDEFVKNLLKKCSINSDNEALNRFWFRGEGNINWETTLVPNAYRNLAVSFKYISNDLFESGNVKEIEKQLVAEFYRKSIPYLQFKGIENNSWNRYFLMQHYNMYTRLLDWTENVLLALFFAVSDLNSKNDDAIVYILQPLKLNDITIKNILKNDNSYLFIPFTSEPQKPQTLIDDIGKIRVKELMRRYLTMDFKSKSEENINPEFLPLAIYPTLIDSRMSAQKACFTLFGNRINGLVSIKNKYKDIVKSIVIKKSAKDKILKELQLLGIDYESIFPDLDGLGKSIMAKYRNKFFDNRETLMHVIDNYNIF